MKLSCRRSAAVLSAGCVAAVATIASLLVSSPAGAVASGCVSPPDYAHTIPTQIAGPAETPSAGGTVYYATVGGDRKTYVAETTITGPGRTVESRPVEENVSVPVDDALAVLARQDERAEPVAEACGVESGLPVVVVDVQQSALGADLGRRFGFVDRRGDAVHVQDPCERQAAEAGADDRDAGRGRRLGKRAGCVHGGFRSTRARRATHDRP